MTVRGPIRPEDLGFTSLHEHILVDLAETFRGRYRQILPNVPIPDGPFVIERRSTPAARHPPVRREPEARR